MDKATKREYSSLLQRERSGLVWFSIEVFGGSILGMGLMSIYLGILMMAWRLFTWGTVEMLGYPMEQARSAIAPMVFIPGAVILVFAVIAYFVRRSA